MAEIISYPTATPKSGDYLLGAQLAPAGSIDAAPTKKFTVGDVSGTPDNNSQLFETVGLKFKWNTEDNSYQVLSNRIGTGYNGLRYSKLYIEFENLELKAGSTYSLIMERFKARGRSGDNYPSSFKRMSNNGAVAPFNQRVFELPITTTTGQFFDFKFDLYYTDGAKGFPVPSGFNGKTGGKSQSVQFIGFRIAKTTNGVTQVSPMLAQLRMRGVAGQVNAGTNPVITFSTY